ncbi:YbaK/EbsC family protein [Pararhizobium antarcticum]|uniref:Cys-tRNA(Pro)/cys-tRNA(Cys) deacylase n=1 Tax=Pararhizobium antarcticum TaxID=1798805 RepID=A0A657LSE0_9HYPH|nr:YbaK/EbsC family protein [Pararhizobium antarcticum]OJF94247.1 cys-tRNA(pro)/cys-tRNA(cys) deacylase [Rhizobium sp. 58]OJF96273.1 cys-tRNA(pro)/cys-tRNA(cys) deacylase [Pararhizobium antarcticum]
MSLHSVKAFFAEHAPDITVIELAQSTATVAQAAEGHGVAPGQIAKTLALRVGDDVILIVTRGDARLDNRKFKARFASKAKMLALDEVEAETGHPIGGVCPFGLVKPHTIYCDVSLRAFKEVVPAAGATNAAVRIDPMRMADLTGAEWIDVSET